MYTLEDDQETSSNLHKRDIAAAGASNGGTNSVPPSPSLAQRLSPTQITRSLKKLTTPGKTAFLSRSTTLLSRLPLGGQQSGTATTNKNVALAALTIACLGVFFTALDQTVVVTALPQVIVDLQIPFTQLDHASWIISAYLLGFIIAMPLMGRVSDIYGRRRIFLICLTIFGISSIFCGLAPLLGQIADLSFLNVLNIDTSSPGLIWLIGARLFQAVGGGAVVPVAMAIASDFYGQERRGLALGIIGAVTEGGGVLGPLYGALIVQHLGWQWIFYLNLPIVCGLIAAAWFFIPKGTRLREDVDWIGAILLGLALTCLSLGLAQQGTDLGPTAANSAAPQNNPISLGLAAVFLVAFVCVERKRRWPVVDLSLFKRFPFTASSLVSLFVGAALIIAMADIPIFVDTVLQRPVLDSGLALLRLTAMIPIGAFLGGWLCGRISCRFTGILGLLFTAAGFYLMSRWPIHVDWNQITVSTVTTGFGFGLVIAPIGTTAINAVKVKQTGMSSAIVTALRMVGMMLGLAALTSWALAYFKQLASTYPSLPPSASADQFSQWSKGYAAHLIESAHTVYGAVFFTSMILCLIAIIPAFFLWGSKPPVVEQEEHEEAPLPATVPVPAPHEATTVPDAAPLAAADVLQTSQGSQPPDPPALDNGNGGKGGRNPKKRRRLIFAGASILLISLLIGAGILAAFNWQSDATTDTSSPSNTSPDLSATATPIAGPRMIQLALDQGALTSLFVSQLNLQQGALTDLQVIPTPNDGLILSLNLHIDANGIHRVMPVEMDSTVGIDSQQNIQLRVLHLKRDGLDAGSAAATNMQSAVNQMILTSLMPSLRGELRGVKLISVHTSTTLACGKGTEMLVLLIEAPPIQGIAAQPTPVPFCFKGAVDINKLLPH